MSSFVADKIVMDGLTFDDVLLGVENTLFTPHHAQRAFRYGRYGHGD